MTIKFKPGQRKSSSGAQRHWTTAEIDRGIAMRVDDELDWDEIAKALGRPEDGVRTKINVEMGRRQAESGGALMRKLTPQQIRERDARRNGYDARDTTGIFFGDPPRGFSALDRQQRAHD